MIVSVNSRLWGSRTVTRLSPALPEDVNAKWLKLKQEDAMETKNQRAGSGSHELRGVPKAALGSSSGPLMSNHARHAILRVALFSVFLTGHVTGAPMVGALVEINSGLINGGLPTTFAAPGCAFSSGFGVFSRFENLTCSRPEG